MRAAVRLFRMLMKPRGSTIVLVAVALTAFLTLMAFVIDAAGAYVTTARLQSFTDSAADAGIARVADLMVEYAARREPDPPPGADPRDYLTEEDRQAILARSEPREAVESVLARNRDAYGMTLDGTDIVYPVAPVNCADVAPRNVELTVRARKNYLFLLGRLLNGSEGSLLEATSIQTMRLCPV